MRNYYFPMFISPPKFEHHPPTSNAIKHFSSLLMTVKKRLKYDELWNLLSDNFQSPLAPCKNNMAYAQGSS